MDRQFLTVMPELDPDIPIHRAILRRTNRDCRDIGERSDAVLRTTMPGSDE
jgi:hypothetical protein